MVLEKAIERLKNLAIHHHDDTFHENEEALKLGIEAIRCIREIRTVSPYGKIGCLPGEKRSKKGGK